MGALSESIWLEFLSECFIKSTIVLAFGFLLSYLCRKKPSSLRHFILSVSLIGLLIFPLLSFVHTGWQTGLLPTWTSEAGYSSKSDISLTNRQKQPFAYASNAAEGSRSLGKKYPIQTTLAHDGGPRLWALFKNILLLVWLSGLIFINR